MTDAKANHETRITALENAGGGGTTIYHSEVRLTFSSGHAATDIPVSSYYLISAIPNTNPGASSTSYFMIPARYYSNSYWQVVGIEIWGSQIQVLGNSSTERIDTVIFYIDR